MTKFDDIYEVAADNYGIVTAAEAAKEGAATSEVSRWVQTGWLEKVGRGVYRLTRYIPTPYDSYATAVALAGPGSYLYGESVLAMHGLAPTNPKRILVATPRRVRRNLPDGIEMVRLPAGAPVTVYEGIPSQSVRDAILACKGKLMGERLRQAAGNAQRVGLITKGQRDELMEELS
jgi:predicted transcriptional regulator of viral defense system